MSSAVAEKPKGRVDVSKPIDIDQMRGFRSALIDQIADALPVAMKKSADRLVRCLFTEFQRNEMLAKCSAASIFGCAIQAAQLGLEIGGPLGQAYMVPYWNAKKGMFEAQFQVGYRGLMMLAHRSDRLMQFAAYEVRANDLFAVQLGTQPKIDHAPVRGDRGEVEGYYAVMRLVNGGVDFEYMTRAEVQAHRERYSKQKETDKNPWVNSFDEMAKKTVIRRISKRAPLTVEIKQAVGLDEMAEAGVPQRLAGLVREMPGAIMGDSDRTGQLRDRLKGVTGDPAPAAGDSDGDLTDEDGNPVHANPMEDVK